MLLDEFIEAFRIKVNYKGQKRKKLNCPPGYQPNEDGTACVPMTATHKQHLKIGARKAKIDKKAQGDTLRRKTNIRTKRAMKFRKQLGV